MSEYNTIKFEVSEHIASITLNRPDAANGINLEMGRELAQVALRCERDPAIRAVVLTSSGKLFCGGGDIIEMSGFNDMGVNMKALVDSLHRALISFANMSAPLLVAVNGTAAGAGFSLALAGDYVISVDSARFTMAYTKIGLSPDGGASYNLPRIVGARRAFELIATNRVLSAQEALEWGIVNQLADASELMDTTMQIAADLAQGSRDSNGAVKQLLKASFGNSLEQQLEMESRLISDNAAGENGREGVSAFLEKRSPVYK